MSVPLPPAASTARRSQQRPHQLGNMGKSGASSCSMNFKHFQASWSNKYLKHREFAIEAFEAPVVEAPSIKWLLLLQASQLQMVTNQRPTKSTSGPVMAGYWLVNGWPLMVNDAHAHVINQYWLWVENVFIASSNEVALLFSFSRTWQKKKNTCRVAPCRTTEWHLQSTSIYGDPFNYSLKRLIDSILVQHFNQ